MCCTRSRASAAALAEFVAVVLVRVRVLVWGIEGPKKSEAELPLVSRLAGTREAGVSEALGLWRGLGPLLPVTRRRARGEPHVGEIAVESLFLPTEGKATGGGLGGVERN